MSFSWQARIQWMMQLQDNIDKSNPSNPNPCRFARKMWCGPPDGFRHLCSPIWTSMIQWFTHTTHQLVYFLTLWWTYSSTLTSERILPMLLRTLEKARKNKMGVAGFGGYGVTSEQTWPSVQIPHFPNPGFIQWIVWSQITYTFTQQIHWNLSIKIAYYIYIPTSCGRNHPPKTHPGTGHIPRLSRLRGEDGRCFDLMQCWRRFSATLLAGQGAVWVCGSVGDKISPRFGQIFWVGQKKQWRDVKLFFHVHPEPWWGNDPIWRAYFSDGLKPPTSRDRWLSHEWFAFFLYKSEDFWVLHSWQEGEWCFQLAHYPSTCIYTKFGFDSLSSW